MSIINRYFLKVTLKPVTASLAVILTLVVVSELIDKLDKFLAGGASISKVTSYLLYSMPFHTVEIIPVALMLGMLFALGALGRYRELAAAMAGGLGPAKIARVFLWLGLAVSLAVLTINETVIPYTTAKARQIYHQDIKRIGFSRQTKFDRLTVSGKEGRVYSIGLFDSESGAMEKVVVETLQNGEPVEQIYANKAVWTGKGWKFSQGTLRRFNSGSFEISNEEIFQEKELSFLDRPEDMTFEEVQPETLNYKSYNRLLRRMRALGITTRKHEVELHIKLAFPLASFVVVLLALPLGIGAATRPSGKSGYVKMLTYVLVTVFAYFGMLEIGRALGQKYIPPVAGAWLANSVFVAISSLFWLNTLRLSQVTRR